MADQINKLEEEKQLTARDILVKVQRLEVYIRKAERRIISNEKKLAQLKEKLKTELKIIKGRLTA